MMSMFIMQVTNESIIFLQYLTERLHLHNFTERLFCSVGCMYISALCYTEENNEVIEAAGNTSRFGKDPTLKLRLDTCNIAIMKIDKHQNGS